MNMKSREVTNRAEENVKIYVPGGLATKGAVIVSESDEVKIYPHPDGSPLKTTNC